MSSLRFTPLCTRRLTPLCHARTLWRLVASLVAAPLLQAGTTGAHEAEAHEAEVDHSSRRSELEAPFASPVSSFYFTGAVGASTIGPALRGLASVAFGHWFCGVGGGASQELFPGKSPALALIELGPVAGLHTRSRYFVGAVGVGVGYVDVTKRGRYLGVSDGWFAEEDYAAIEAQTIGIPVMVHGMVHWGPIGLGALIFGNANLTQSEVGAAASLNLGFI